MAPTIYKSIRFGAMDGPKLGKFIQLWTKDGSKTLEQLIKIGSHGWPQNFIYVKGL